MPASTLFAAEANMRGLDALLAILRRFRTSLASGLGAFWPAGREALLRQLEARTRQQELAVEQKKLDLDTQRARSVIDLVQRIEKIKDAKSREKIRSVLLANDIKLLPPPGGEPA